MSDHVKVFVVDGGGNQAVMSLPVSATKSQADAFLLTYSKCGVVRGQTVEAQSITVTVPSAGANVDYGVKCLFVFGQDKTQFTSLSPKETGEVKYKKGRVLTTAEKTLMLADWKTAQGLSAAYTLRRNRFLQHK